MASCEDCREPACHGFPEATAAVAPIPTGRPSLFIALLLTLITFWVMVLAAGIRFPAGREIGATFRDALRTRAGRIGLAWVVGTLLFNVVETGLDSAIGPALGLDFTHVIHRFEGDLVAGLQDTLLGHALAPVWAWVYVFLYPSLLLLPLVIYHASGKHEHTKGYIGAFVFNYLFALPFYLFVPVTETGWSGTVERVKPLLDGVWPVFTEVVRSSSALDNCFPSLHTSLSFTVAFYALLHGPKRLQRVGWVGAVLVMLSTWALGIHWISDAAAGIMLGYLAARMGPILAGRVVSLEPAPVASTWSRRK
ncbi:MAG: inositol phosphorylceramide synthase [Planctomycetota bacterium]|nr:MAG: inositol phosphorylceramide synthase [Planctomycetota bacterium]